LQSIEACCLLCDSNVTDCEKTLIFLVKSLKVAQDLISMLVEQLAQMKLGVGLYFEPLPQLRPSTQCAIRMINVQACPICGEEFYFYDICIASSSHTYRPWCLVAFPMSSKKCKVVICEKVFQKDWCASFGLSKTMAICVVHSRWRVSKMLEVFN
jgi:hypothetical protein